MDSDTTPQNPSTKSSQSLKGVTDLHKIAATVAEAVWGKSDLAVALEDKSGRGGGKVYFASADNVHPVKVVVKILGENASFPIAHRRAEAGVEALRKAGVIAPCLTIGPDWTAETFAGDPVADGSIFKFDQNRASPEKLGALLAKVHSTPIEWYEPHRRATIDRDPRISAMLREIPAHSHAWQPVPWGLETGMACTGANFPHPEAAKAMFDAMVDSKILDKFFRDDSFYPCSPAGKRVVTIHGDFKADNVLHDARRNELMAIDFELISVGPAALDLAFATVFWLGANRSSPEYRRAFYDAYLGGMGQSVDDVTVMQTQLDAEVLALLVLAGPLSSVYDAQCVLLRGIDHYTASGSLRASSNDTSTGAECIKFLGDAIKEVRASAKMTEEAVSTGLLATMCARKCGSESLWALLDELKEDGMLRLFGVHPSQ